MKSRCDRLSVRAPLAASLKAILTAIAMVNVPRRSADARRPEFNAIVDVIKVERAKTNKNIICSLELLFIVVVHSCFLHSLFTVCLIHFIRRQKS
jgi:hypothetical protein